MLSREVVRLSWESCECSSPPTREFCVRLEQVKSGAGDGGGCWFGNSSGERPC